jgi:[protein-PII] uridylyltransferase
MLYLLSFADIKAVGPEAWTSWKDSLLSELFLKTSHFLGKSTALPKIPTENEMAKRLEEYLPAERVSEYLEHLPSRYLSCYSWQETAHHIQMALSLTEHPLVTEWTYEKRTHATVTLCTRDRYGLFSRIAGSMLLSRLNVLEAQIHTWGNGIVLDAFRVEDPTGEVERRLEQFRKYLEGIYSGDLSLKTLLAQHETSNGALQKVVPRVPAEVKINNQDSDFYTIVEVVGEDRLGILYELTRALTDHGCDIHFARISTLGNRIVDVFYVQDNLGEKLEGKNATEGLKETLLNRLRTRA